MEEHSIVLTNVGDLIFWWLVRNYVGRHIMKLFNKISGKKRILQKIKRVISIKSKKPQGTQISGMPIHGKTPTYHIINFRLYIDSKATIPVSVKAINCTFMYNDLVIQNMTWADGDVLASNGIEVHPITIPAQKGNDQICPLNFFPHIPRLPESNEGWGIKGTIKFQCFLGNFEKDFELKDISIPNRWDDWRLEYQKLYNLVFGTIGGKNE